jgi:hypothetical protein
MLVYGDAERVERIADMRAGILETLRLVERMAAGIERHAALVSAFLALSELAQGVADAAFGQRGADGNSRQEQVVSTALVALARTVDESWRSGFQERTLPWSALSALNGLDGPEALRIKEAEGYAFYALYPEAYLEAARGSGLGPRTTVIGIRSIGTGLAAVVAAALDTAIPVTVRPVGHPFRREIRIDAALAEQLTADPDRSFAIVDEGPGLSGSSFGAVADWLEGRGVAGDRIRFFPSHPGDLGPEAADAHRARWSSARRHLVSADDLLLKDGRLGAWVTELVGTLEMPLEDLSGGGWRSQRYRSEADWPAANVQQERRKFRAHAGGASWLIKFSGLGPPGVAKLRQARQLHAAGFTPQVAGLRHGFLVERWIERASSLDQISCDRSLLIRGVASYLGFRARAFPAPAGPGAGLEQLAQMACHNAGQALGPEAAAALARPLSRALELQRRVRRIRIDGRLHAHEWLVAHGRLIKTDALDHCAGHDLIGCQDVAWDIAGAHTEFMLDRAETARLCDIVEQESGHRVDAELLAFLEPCYLAFQLGAATLAARAIGGHEAVRLRRAAERYAARLRWILAAGTTGVDIT